MVSFLEKVQTEGSARGPAANGPMRPPELFQIVLPRVAKITARAVASMCHGGCTVPLALSGSASVFGSPF
jgi:hypothetical protein